MLEQLMRDLPPAYASTEPSKKVALMFIGNSGSGKSTLLNQLGGNFKEDVAWMEGVTTEIQEQVVMLRGSEVILMDVPGLFEFEDERTKRNAAMLSEALQRGYRYKLYFVLAGENRGVSPKELLMMSIVNDCVRQLDNTKITFQVIVNQIQGDKQWKLYQDRVANDNFQSLFAKLNEGKYKFDITISSVPLLPHDTQMVTNMEFKEMVTQDVLQHQETPLNLVKQIAVSNRDLTTFEKAMLVFLSPLLVVGGVAVGAVALACGTVGRVVGGVTYGTYLGGKRVVGIIKSHAQ